MAGGPIRNLFRVEKGLSAVMDDAPVAAANADMVGHCVDGGWA